MALLRIWAALSLLPLIACSGNGPATATDGAADQKKADRSASAAPPIHLDQTSVLTADGQPQEEQTYRTMLENCRKAGAATRPLPPGDLEKIGRVHLEVWIGPQKQSRREQEWHLDASQTCEFSLTHVDRTEIVDAKGRLTAIDGVTHEVNVQELGEPPTLDPLSADDGEMTEAHRKAGWSKQGTANALGAQCAIWQDSTGFQVCVWTGGRQWGYSADGMTALKGGVSRSDSIVLWARPGRDSTWKLETREFSVGKPLDDRAFAIPENATRRASP